MPSIAILYADPLIGTLFRDAFQQEGWKVHTHRMRNDPEAAVRDLLERPPQLLLIEFHPRWETVFKRILAGIRTRDTVAGLPTLVSHYEDEPLDGMRSLLPEQGHVVLTHPYDVDVLFDVAEQLVGAQPD